MSSRTPSVELPIGGMHCAACVRRVEQALEAVEGVSGAEVNLASESARVSFAAKPVDRDALGRAVREAGYEILELAQDSLETLLDEREAERAEATADAFRRFWVGAALSIPVLLVGHGSMVPGLRSLFAAVGPGTERLLWALSGLLTIPIMTYVGGRFFRDGWKAFRRHEANMDTLVALGTGAAWVYSTAAVAMPALFPEGTAQPFFEATAVVITLVVLGQALESRAKGRTSQALRRLMELSPPTARVVHGAEEIEVPLTEVRSGDTVVIRPGEQVPVDATVLEGASAVDESMLTGESIPVDKAPGSEVTGGTLNTNGVLYARVERVGSDTFLARMIDRVREAQGSKPPIQRTVDVVASVFVPLVMIVSVSAFAVWYVLGPQPALNYAAVVAVAVLVIACPCALGLATPISIMVGVGKAAELGVLVRNGEAIERAQAVEVVLLDKTGTLTEGRPELVDVIPLNGMREDEVLSLAAAAELGSEHPLGRAVVAGARARGIEAGVAEGFRAVPGGGVEAEVRGRTVRIGTPAFVSGDSEAHAGSESDAIFERLAEDGKTPLAMAVDGAIMGVLGLADRVKADSAAAVARLRSMGLRVVMITGDHEATARAVARAVGVHDYHARVLPEEKADEVIGLQDVGLRVAMVGDGINDAPALAQADVGIAMGTGTDIALEAGDVALIGDSLHGVADALAVSRATIRNIKQNLVGAFFYNVLGIPIAAGALYPFFGVLLSPMIAGAAMAFSSVTVVSNANRLRTFRPRR